MKTLQRSEKERVFGEKFLNVIHDIWTNKEKSSVVGASVAFIDRHWRFRYIVLMAFMKNDGHPAAEVAKLIRDRTASLYAVDLPSMMKFTVSDTTTSARVVAKHFAGAQQEDCCMHLLNLCINYGIELKENKTAVEIYDKDTKTCTKVKKIVTPSGALPEGASVIRKLRALNNLFSNGDRLEALARI